jgi:hypothetical protein
VLFSLSARAASGPVVRAVLQEARPLDGVGASTASQDAASLDPAAAVRLLHAGAPVELAAAGAVDIVRSGGGAGDHGTPHGDVAVHSSAGEGHGKETDAPSTAAPNLKVFARCPAPCTAPTAGRAEARFPVLPVRRGMPIGTFVDAAAAHFGPDDVRSTGAARSSAFLVVDAASREVAAGLSGYARGGWMTQFDGPRAAEVAEMWSCFGGGTFIHISRGSESFAVQNTGSVVFHSSAKDNNYKILSRETIQYEVRHGEAAANLVFGRIPKSKPTDTLAGVIAGGSPIGTFGDGVQISVHPSTREVTLALTASNRSITFGSDCVTVTSL